MRVFLHRARGVAIGKNVWISYNAILETAYPNLITIDDDAFIGVGVIIIAHFKETRRGVKIGKNAFVGPGVIILPDVIIGDGAVVTAGSVVTHSVPAMTIVQGNPAVPIAKVWRSAVARYTPERIFEAAQTSSQETKDHTCRLSQ